MNASITHMLDFAGKVVRTETEGPERVPLPDSIKVGHNAYDVRPMDELEVARSGNIGFCNDSDMEIGIAESMKPARQVEVMLHEILHACFESGSLRNDAPLDEEQVVTVLAKQLLMVLIDNPALRAWMFENEPRIAAP